MFLNTCPFCEHGNPTDSKFCNACGGALHLAPCPRCGAVSDVAATTCYQCRGRLPGHRTDAIDPVEPAAEVSKPLRRPSIRVMVGTAVLAAIATLGYYTYRQVSLADAPRPPAEGEASGRGGSGGASIVRREAAVRDRTPAKAGGSAQPLSPAASSPEPLPAGPKRAAANQSRADRTPVESQNAKAGVAPIARTKSINESRASERGWLRPEACTDAVAALGLCTFKPAERKEAEKLAAKKAQIARPQSAGAGKAGGKDLRQGETCTTAVAALGLCTPKLTREGK